MSVARSVSSTHRPAAARAERDRRPWQPPRTQGGTAMAKFAPTLLTSALLIAPLAAQSADLTIWWAKGFYPEEEEGIRRVVADFQRDTGTSVELTLPTASDMSVKLTAALEAGQPPDLVFNSGPYPSYMRWAYEGRFVDLSDVVEPIAKSINPALLQASYLLNGKTGKRAYYS